MPAILVAHFVFAGAGWSVFLAMYFPHFLMMGGFLARLAWACWAMAKGRAGPWETHMHTGGGSEEDDDDDDVLE